MFILNIMLNIMLTYGILREFFHFSRNDVRSGPLPGHVLCWALPLQVPRPCLPMGHYSSYVCEVCVTYWKLANMDDPSQAVDDANKRPVELVPCIQEEFREHFYVWHHYEDQDGLAALTAALWAASEVVVLFLRSPL